MCLFLHVVVIVVVVIVVAAAAAAVVVVVVVVVVGVRSFIRLTVRPLMGVRPPPTVSVMQLLLFLLLW